MFCRHESLLTGCLFDVGALGYAAGDTLRRRIVHRPKAYFVIAAALAIGAIIGGVLSRPAGAQGGSPVDIVSPLPLPVTAHDLDNPARNAINIVICTNTSRCPSSYSVPAKKRLVIEYVSSRIPPGQPTPPAIGLFTRAGGQGGIFYVPTEPGIGGEWIASRKVWLCADPGTSVFYQSAGAALGADIYLSGYLIDFP
jgi:hypothetical protein